MFNPHEASSSGVIGSINEDSERIATVIRDLNIPFNRIPERQITRDDQTTVRDDDVGTESVELTIIEPPPIEIATPIDTDVLESTE